MYEIAIFRNMVADMYFHSLPTFVLMNHLTQRFFLTLFVSICLMGCQSASESSSSETSSPNASNSSSQNAEASDDAKWQSLFNGEDLTGWKIHGTEKWYAENGEIICESGPDAEYGYLATDQIFKDFELSVEFKQEADGNSGIFFRSSLDGTKIAGWQAEVAPPNHDSGGIYESYGRGWLQQIPDEEEGHLKMGEWNQMRIRAKGDRVTTWLNDHQMVDFEDEKIGQAEGVIALQIHSGGGIKVRWKNLKIKEI